MLQRQVRPWLALTVAALLPRVAGAILRPAWHDEYYSAWVSSLSWGDFLAALRFDSGPPLFYALTKLAGGLGVAALPTARALSVATGVAAVLMTAAVVRRRISPAAGWLAGYLIALHPLAVAWSCEGRAYGTLLLAATLAWERIETLGRSGKGTVGLAAAVALACWSHGLGLILAAAATVAAATLPRQARVRALAAVAAGLVSFLPWVPVMIGQPPAAIAWMTDSWQRLPIAERALASLRFVPPLAPFGAHTDLPSAGATLQILAAAAFLALLVSARAPSSWWLLVGIPAVALPVLTALGVPVFAPTRGEVLYLPTVLGLLAAGGGRWRPAVGWSLAAAGTLLSGVAVVSWSATPPRREAQVAAAVRRALPEGGTVITSGYWWLDLWYHLERDRTVYQLVAYPELAGRHPGWHVDRHDPPDPGEVDRLAALPPRAVVVTPGLSTAPALERLAARAGLRPGLAVPGGIAYLPAEKGSER